MTDRNYCDLARDAAHEVAETPIHERGFTLAALSNHLRACDTCTTTPRETDEMPEEGDQ